MWLVYPLFAPATRTRGETLSPALDAALLHGSSIGGARPKALLNDPSRTVIAKFSSTTDTYPVVKAEFVAMRWRNSLDWTPHLSSWSASVGATCCSSTVSTAPATEHVEDLCRH